MAHNVFNKSKEDAVDHIHPVIAEIAEVWERAIAAKHDSSHKVNSIKSVIASGSSPKSDIPHNMERSLHMGIRGPLYSKKDLEDDAILGFQVIRSDDYQVDGLASVRERMVKRLAGGPVYVSVDIDVLDPAHAPGTGTPEAGGLTSRELLHSLRSLTGLNVVGADIVEVSPAYDHAELTGIAAAHVGYELLSVMSANR